MRRGGRVLTSKERQISRILIDDTNTHNFLNYNLVKKLKLPQVPCSHIYIVSLANVYDKDELDTVLNQVGIKIQEYHYNILARYLG